MKNRQEIIRPSKTLPLGRSLVVALAPFLLSRALFQVSRLPILFGKPCNSPGVDQLAASSMHGELHGSMHREFVLYVFYHTDRQTDRDTIKGFWAQPPGKPVRMRIETAAEVQTFVKTYVNFLTSFWTLVRINLQTAAEVRTFVKTYVNFLTSFWTGRRFSAILLNRVFVLYVFYHVLRNAPHPADRRTHN